MLRTILTILFFILLLWLISSCKPDPLTLVKNSKIDSLQNQLLAKDAEYNALELKYKECKVLNQTEDKYAEVSKYKKSDCVTVWGKWKGVVKGAYYSSEDNKTVYYRVSILQEDDSFVDENYYESELKYGDCIY